MGKFLSTPPMGWNSYDYYDTTVTEAEVRANADYMAKHLKEYGWEYIVVDIEWYSNDAGAQRDKYQYIPFGDNEMDEYGRFQPSPNRFPSSAGGKGFKPLADYIHGLGLKFGIHIMRGIPREAAHRHCQVLGCAETADRIADPSSICGWNPDMYGVRHTEGGQAYYDSLIAMYADWGVDFIKCDDICDSWMYREIPFSGWEETRMLHRAIEKCGREIVLSLSPGPAHIDRAWEYSKYANMWRITDDLWDNWELVKNMFYRCELWQSYVKEGSFPDCDMLPLGRIGRGFGEERNCNLSKEEQKTLMTLWCMFRSPLMIGAELTKLDEWTTGLLTNREILGLLKKTCRGEQVLRDETKAVWKNKDSSTGKLCVALFNLSDEEQNLTMALSEIDSDLNAEEYTMHELWEHTKKAALDGKVTVMVPAHGVRVYSL